MLRPDLLRYRRLRQLRTLRPSPPTRSDRTHLREPSQRLLRRDGVTFDTAVAILRSRDGVTVDDRELARLAATFPERSRPRIEPDSDATTRAPGSQRADDRVLATEHEGHKKSVLEALEQSLATLSMEDRVILKLRFWEGLTVADISRALGLEQRPLYRRLQRLIARLKASLEEAGVSAAEVGRLLTGEVG